MDPQEPVYPELDQEIAHLRRELEASGYRGKDLEERLRNYRIHIANRRAVNRPQEIE